MSEAPEAVQRTPSAMNLKITAPDKHSADTRDAAINNPLMVQLQQRERDLEAYVVTRNIDGPHYVQRTIDSYEDF